MSNSPVGALRDGATLEDAATENSATQDAATMAGVASVDPPAPAFDKAPVVEPERAVGRRYIELGSREYVRAAAGMCASGFATFALLYCVQPLMPIFSSVFRVSPAEASFALSASTMVLTVTIFLAGVASERFGRKPVMAASLFASGALSLASAVAPSWTVFLGLRALMGVAAGGVPAVAMSYLAEEMHPAGLGLAMGVYVAGNAFGGMLGRLLTGAVAEAFGWRVAMLSLSLLGLASAVAFLVLLPASRNFVPSRSRSLADHVVVFRRLLGSRRLVLLLGFGFLLAGPFVTVYNIAGYRLSAAPYDLGQTGIGLIFLVYVFGIVGSTVVGRGADRIGRARALTSSILAVAAGLLLTLGRPLLVIIAGIAVMTFGFFGAHTVASAWIGRLGRDQKGHAAALYLFSFYAGTSVLSSLGGWAWQLDRWGGVIAVCFAMAALATWLSLLAARR